MSKKRALEYLKDTRFNGDEYIGVRVEPLKNGQSPSWPDEYLIKGKLSKDGWPFNSKAEKIILESKNPEIDLIIVDPNTIIELWSIDSNGKLNSPIFRN